MNFTEAHVLNSFFGASPISFDNIDDLIENVPDIIIWAAPFMFLFVLAEWYFARKHAHPHYEKKETRGSIMVGIGNVIISTLLKLSLFSLFILVYNMVPWRMPLDWWTFLPCYIIFDLCSYWAHRVSHQHRFWWGTHVVHHSAEHYNLTVSFRLSWVQHLKIIFFLPVAFLGFHPVIIFVVSQIAVLFQFWVHTKYIPKLHRVIEFLFATPSNHRVHHGRQKKYMNKNYGATFIFWDRLFGTYQREEEQVEYGITTNIEKKGNPFHINFHEYRAMWTDIKEAKGIRKKLFYIFGNPIAIAADKKKRAQKPVQEQQSGAEEAPGIAQRA